MDSRCSPNKHCCSTTQRPEATKGHGFSLSTCKAHLAFWPPNCMHNTPYTHIGPPSPALHTAQHSPQAGTNHLYSQSQRPKFTKEAVTTPH